MRDMKDSGVAWIGAVPSDYGTASIGSLFTIKKDIIGREPETVLSITQAGIRPKDLSSNEGQNASSYAHYQVVNVGDFAMNHMDLLTGWIDISKYEGVTSPDYRVFTLNDKEMSADYFLRVFQYYYTNKVFFGFGQGVATLGRWRLPAINFKKIDVPVPPVPGQRRIVAAIDDSVGKVDALIPNVQNQIEKLKTFKQSLITEIVTKGLDPTVPMKDSGVDRLDRIPMHWRIMKQTMLTTRIGDGLHGTPEFDDSSNIFFINGNNLGEKYITVRENTKSVLPSEYEKYRLDLNDRTLLISLNGTIGSISRYNGEIVVFGKSAGYIIVKNNINIDYLSYYLQTRCVKEIFELSFAGTTINNLSLETLRNLRVCVPPHEEQEAIVVYLDEKCSQIDRLIAIKQSKIEKLEQYKRSLIYEYVTGKKEVC